MYRFAHHVKLNFVGTLNYSFNFVIRYTEEELYDSTLPNADRDRIFQVDEYGYLFIDGRKITNNKDGIAVIYSSIFTRPEEGYVDVTLAINPNGSVVVVKQSHANNAVKRLVGKLFG